MIKGINEIFDIIEPLQNNIFGLSETAFEIVEKEIEKNYSVTKNELIQNSTLGRSNVEVGNIISIENNICELTNGSQRASGVVIEISDQEIKSGAFGIFQTKVSGVVEVGDILSVGKTDGILEKNIDSQFPVGIALENNGSKVSSIYVLIKIFKFIS